MVGRFVVLNVWGHMGSISARWIAPAQRPATADDEEEEETILLDKYVEMYHRVPHFGQEELYSRSN